MNVFSAKLRQPPFGTKLSTRLPKPILSANFALGSPTLSRNDATQQPLAMAASGLNVSSCPHGLGLSPAKASTTYSLGGFPGENSWDLNTQTLTFHILFWLGSVGTYSDTESWSYRAYYASSSRRIYFSIRDSGIIFRIYTTDLTVSHGSNNLRIGLNSVIIQANGVTNTNRLFINGAHVATITPTTPDWTAMTSYSGIRANSLGTTPVVCLLHHALWNVDIAETAAKLFSVEPWALYEDDNLVLKVPTPAAAGGYTHPTLSAATATEITATGFKPRVTYTFA